MKKLSILLFALCIASYTTAQDFALKQLEKSPRHSEWVQIGSGIRKVNCFVTFPEVSAKATVVIIIHENRGLTDWVRSFADQVAEAGYIAIAPDLLSEYKPGISKTTDFANPDDARNAIYDLKTEQVMSDLNAVQVYASKMEAGNGKVVSAGFCWGGSQSFLFAVHNPAIKAALVFYGSAPSTKEDIIKIKAPVYGFYAENDERINAGIPAVETLMAENGKTYEYMKYTGAGHGYMRQGDDPTGSPENKKARDESWVRIKTILEGI